MASYFNPTQNEVTSSSVDNHRLSAVANVTASVTQSPAPIQDAPKSSAAKRSSSVGAAFRSMFSRRSQTPETVPTPWTGQLSSIEIAQAIETQNRSHSAESGFLNSPQNPQPLSSPAPGVGQQPQQLRGRPTTLESNTSSPAARFFTPSIPANKPNAHIGGVIKDGSPRSQSQAMAMQSHRGGSAEVVQSTIVPTTMARPVPVQSGVGTSQQQDPPVAGMQNDEYDSGTQDLRARDIPVAGKHQDLRARDTPVAGMPEDPNYSSRRRNQGGEICRSDKVQLVPQHSAGGTARVPDQQRGTHAGTTSVVEIYYSTPSGQRYLPIVLYESVTMIKIGDHNGQQVYEPVNYNLRSPEDGLRYHKSMDYNDVYHGPLEVAPWNRPVVGRISADESWIINPSAYDPTCPAGGTQQSTQIEDTLVPTFHYASPTGEPEALGTHSDQAEDVEISLLAAVGAAISRGARDVAELPVPSTTANTPNSSINEDDQEDRKVADESMRRNSCYIQPIQHMPGPAQPTLIERASQAGKEALVTVVCTAAAAHGGASAGETIGGDLATSTIGAFAQPIGAAAGRQLGTVVGGVLGATTMRCASRSASRGRRTSSVVRFAEPPSMVQGRGPSTQPSAEMLETTELRRNTTPVDHQALMAMIMSSQQASNEALMDNMAKMFNMSRSEQLKREEQTQNKLETLTKQFEDKAKQETATALQVQHLTSTVRSFRDQLDTNSDFTVDAIQQVRDEMSAKFKELEEKNRDALNAGGDRASSSHTEPATHEPEAFKIGKPATKDASTNQPYAVQCSYCSGSVPKVIAEHCQFCDLYFHPGHLQIH